MNIAGIVKSSFIDYPGCASTVLFLGGCNFNCGYCHNPEIVRGGGSGLREEELFAFLEKRRRFVDAVCISGGEPTLYGEELVQLVLHIKRLGFLVKLDTNGSNPDLLRRLLGIGIQGVEHEGAELEKVGMPGAAEGPLVDHVAMDVKGPWEKYPLIAGLSHGSKQEEATVLRDRAEESVRLLVENGRGIDPVRIGGQKAAFTYELRTTVCRELLSPEDIGVMAQQLKGAACWYLQTFRRRGELLDSAGSYSAYGPEEMEGLKRTAEAAGTVHAVRLR